MKVVAIHTDFRLYWPARLQHLSNALKKRGDIFSVIEIAGAGSNYDFAGRTVVQSDWICLFPEERIEDLDPLRAKKAVMECLNQLNPDVVLAGAFAFTSGASALEWTKKNNKAVIIFDSAKKEELVRSFLVNSVKRFFYSYVDAVLCPSHDWIETYTAWGIPSEAVFFGVTTVDNDFWAEKVPGKNKIDLPEKFFLCVGRQIPCKNFQTAIQAFNKIRDKYSRKVDFVFVGEGEEREELEKLAGEKDRSRFHFLPFQSPEKLREIYQRALALVLPSYSETWGLVVNEAMAAGLPVLVSFECGCFDTLVKENMNGFGYLSSDTEGWTEGMEKMLRLSEQELLKMKTESRNIIANWGLDRFSGGAMQAIDYAVRHKRRRFYFVGKNLLQKWNGRYNPI